MGNANKNWRTVSVNQDGTVIMAGIGNGRLYSSADGGSTWNEEQPAGAVDQYWNTSTCGQTGLMKTVASYGGRFYTQGSAALAGSISGYPFSRA